MVDQPKPPEAPSENKERKPYSTPKLVDYGTVESLTGSGVSGQRSDTQRKKRR